MCSEVTPASSSNVHYNKHTTDLPSGSWGDIVTTIEEKLTSDPQQAVDWIGQLIQKIETCQSNPTVSPGFCKTLTDAKNTLEQAKSCALSDPATAKDLLVTVSGQLSPNWYSKLDTLKSQMAYDPEVSNIQHANKIQVLLAQLQATRSDPTLTDDQKNSMDNAIADLKQAVVKLHPPNDGLEDAEKLLIQAQLNFE